MIKDSIKNYKNYLGLSEYLDKGFEYLVNTNFSDLACGKYPIVSDIVYANVDEYKTKLLSEGKFEAHRRYIDIQYMLKGSEKIGYGEISNFSDATDYDKEKDIIFLNKTDKENNFITMSEGEFAIFFPQDAHMPQIKDNSDESVKKVVVKIIYNQTL